MTVYDGICQVGRIPDAYVRYIYLSYTHIITFLQVPDDPADGKQIPSAGFEPTRLPGPTKKNSTASVHL